MEQSGMMEWSGAEQNDRIEITFHGLDIL